jgi:hypothetical protein
MHMEHLYIEALLEDRRRQAADQRLRHTRRQTAPPRPAGPTDRARPALQGLLGRMRGRTRGAWTSPTGA